MVNRLLLDKTRLLVTKPGVEATANAIPEGNKLFDSTWLFSSTIVEAGLHIDNASPKFGFFEQVIQWDIATDTSLPQYIDFTPLSYVPTVVLINLSDPHYWERHGMVLLGSEPRIERSEYYRTGEVTVTNSRITIPRIRSPSWYYRESFLYLIMGM
ncbi:hypothetical protein ACI0FM_08725 [Paenochrobactrum sp. BZR 588]|uniref:hypothetical protein n=1 Tax=unclassified Paenochrobactrum TaxID=2639760 RepID=UPI0038550679